MALATAFISKVTARLLLYCFRMFISAHYSGGYTAHIQKLESERTHERTSATGTAYLQTLHFALAYNVRATPGELLTYLAGGIGSW